MADIASALDPVFARFVASDAGRGYTPRMGDPMGFQVRDHVIYDLDLEKRLQSGNTALLSITLMPDKKVSLNVTDLGETFGKTFSVSGMDADDAAAQVLATAFELYQEADPAKCLQSFLTEEMGYGPIEALEPGAVIDEFNHS